jgi:hypothetical protein
VDASSKAYCLEAAAAGIAKASNHQLGHWFWNETAAGATIHFPVTEQRSAVMVCRGERGIWQRRYWEHLIRDDRDYAGHMH